MASVFCKLPCRIAQPKDRHGRVFFVLVCFSALPLAQAGRLLVGRFACSLVYQLVRRQDTHARKPHSFLAKSDVCIRPPNEMLGFPKLSCGKHINIIYIYIYKYVQMSPPHGTWFGEFELCFFGVSCLFCFIHFAAIGGCHK